MNENFISFSRIDDLSVVNISINFRSHPACICLDVKDCIGQGYDGAASMSGHVSWVQVLLRELAPMAAYVHCASHRLNLMLNSCSQLPPIHNMFCILSDVINCFNDSGKRRAMLDENLLTICDTRFIQRHTAILRFKCIRGHADRSQFGRTHKIKSGELSNAISTSSFIVSIAAAKKVMSITLPLLRRLQSPNLDLSAGMAMAHDIESRLVA